MHLLPIVDGTGASCGVAGNPLHAVPTVVAKATCLPEVCGDGALYVDPLDVDSIAAGLARVLEDKDLAGELSERGLARAKKFTWSACAQKTLAAYAAAGC